MHAAWDHLRSLLLDSMIQFVFPIKLSNECYLFLTPALQHARLNNDWGGSSNREGEVGVVVNTHETLLAANRECLVVAYTAPCMKVQEYFVIDSQVEVVLQVLNTHRDSDFIIL